MLNSHHVSGISPVYTIPSSSQSPSSPLTFLFFPDIIVNINPTTLATHSITINMSPNFFLANICVSQKGNVYSLLFGFNDNILITFVEINVNEGTYKTVSSTFKTYSFSDLFGCIVDDSNSQIIWSFGYWSSAYYEVTAVTPLLPSFNGTTSFLPGIILSQGIIIPPSTLFATSLESSVYKTIAWYQFSVVNEQIQSKEIGNTGITTTAVGSFNSQKKVLLVAFRFSNFSLYAFRFSNFSLFDFRFSIFDFVVEFFVFYITLLFFYLNS